MPVTSVKIIQLNPGDTNAQVQWQTDQQANNTATAYVAQNQADLGDPTKCVTGDASAQLPAANFMVNVAGLNAGTPYFCMCEADGVNSWNQPFGTTGAVATTHLVALKCRAGDDGSDDDGGTNGDPCEVDNGKKLRIRVATEKLGAPGTRLPGISVNFSITGGSGSGTLKHDNVVSNKRGVAKVVLIGGNRGDVQVTASSQSADNQVVIGVTVGS